MLSIKPQKTYLANKPNADECSYIDFCTLILNVRIRYLYYLTTSRI